MSIKNNIIDSLINEDMSSIKLSYLMILLLYLAFIFVGDVKRCCIDYA